MKQQCILCGVEAGDGVPDSERTVLSIRTNVPMGGLKDYEPLLGIIGIWDQRQQKRVDLCGACLLDRLLGADTRVLSNHDLDRPGH